MTSRRDRASHVRPRPPSSGRPRKVVRAPAPAMQRVRQHRGIEPRRQRLPLPARALLALSVVMLGAAVYLTATGAIGPIVASLGSSLEGAIGKLTFSAEPSATEVIATDSPIIAAPANPFTNDATAALQITVPTAVINTAAKVRVYVALQGLSPAPVQDVPVGSTTQVVATVQLTKGVNNFTATIIKDGVESTESPVVSITLDQDPPKVTITAPKNNATVKGTQVTIAGTTQAGSALLAQNAANRTSVSGQAGPDGKFSLTLPITSGANAITMKVTDPAGNETDVDLTVNQGSGNMTARLTSSYYTITLSRPPSSLLFTVSLKDADGNPVAGATCTFTVTIPGLQPITSSPRTTDSSGRASFTVPLTSPGSITKNTGLAVVVCADPTLGQATAQVGLTFK